MVDLQKVLALETQGKVAYQQAAYQEAQHLYQQALEMREQIGSEHPDLVETLTVLGNIQQTLAQYPEAEHLYRRALTICEASYGSTDARTIRVLGDVAGILDEQHFHDQAQSLYEEALQRAEQHAGPADLALTLSKLARFYRVIGQNSQAELLFARALSSYETVSDPDPDTQRHIATCLNNFAYLKLAQDRYVEAETLLRRAMRMNAVSGNDLTTGANLKNLGTAFLGQNENVLGLLCYRQAISLYERVLGKMHPDTIALVAFTNAKQESLFGTQEAT